MSEHLVSPNGRRISDQESSNAHLPEYSHPLIVCVRTDLGATKKVQPIYPAAAKAAGVSGTVEVRVLISEQGQVLEAEIVSGPEQLRDATLAAVRQWIFKPMVIGNYPVQVEGALTFKFSPR
jgi:TonB family protein